MWKMKVLSKRLDSYTSGSESAITSGAALVPGSGAPSVKGAVADDPVVVVSLARLRV